jgi:hypothetical protein
MQVVSLLSNLRPFAVLSPDLLLPVCLVRVSTFLDCLLLLFRISQEPRGIEHLTPPHRLSVKALLFINAEQHADVQACTRTLCS